MNDDTRISYAIRLGVPERLAPGIVAWVFDHRMPGSFLQSVLRNDLRDAVGRADPDNFQALQALVTFLNTFCPGKCWGSKEAVANWAACEPGPSSRFE